MPSGRGAGHAGAHHGAVTAAASDAAAVVVAFGDTMYEVVVPQGVRPGQPFALIANGQRVMVTCPQRAQPGQKIQFRLPIQMSDQEIQSIKLNYEKEGWTRCLTTDLQFKWIARRRAGARTKREAVEKGKRPAVLERGRRGVGG